MYKTKRKDIDAMLFEKTDASIIGLIYFLYNQALTHNESLALISIIKNNNGVYIPEINTKVEFGDYVIKEPDRVYVMEPTLFKLLFTIASCKS